MSGDLSQEEAIARGTAEIMRRLERAGVLSMVRRTQRQGDGRLTIRFEFIGRDEGGHSSAAHCSITVPKTGMTEDRLSGLVQKTCRHHERIAERYNGLPPVTIGPGMSVDHLEVNAPLAARLRRDHGGRAADVVREAVLLLHENRSRLANRSRTGPARLPVPHDIKLNVNRLDHSEELAPGVMWKRHSIVMHRTTLPDVIINGFVGATASEVCDHPILADEGNLVSAISNAGTVKHGKGTAVLSLVTPWIPVPSL